MKRKLPVYRISGTDFYVDVLTEEFCEVARPENRISFDELLQKGDHCELLFDRDTRNVFRGTPEEALNDPAVGWVKIPMLLELDPEGMRLKAAGLQKEQQQPGRRPVKGEDRDQELGF